MRFEFDPEKNAANLAKHGVDLARVEEMDLEMAMVIEDTRREYGERRWLAYAPIEGRLHVLYYTRRGSVLRVIGLRKANARERRKYGEKI